MKAASFKRTGHWDQATHQGFYAESLVAALAAAAGLNFQKYAVDPGIDLTISTPGPRNSQRDPKIEVQVKSWSTPRGTPTDWRYPLDVDAYNLLAGPGHNVPHFLVLCVVPRSVDGYAQAAPDNLRFHHAVYWHSLLDHEPDHTLRSGSTRTISVPKTQLLTPDTLVALVEGRYEEVKAP